MVFEMKIDTKLLTQLKERVKEVTIMTDSCFKYSASLYAHVFCLLGKNMICNYRAALHWPWLSFLRSGDDCGLFAFSRPEAFWNVIQIVQSKMQSETESLSMMTAEIWLQGSKEDGRENLRRNCI